MKFTPEVIAALQTLKDNAENDFERHRIAVLERDLTAPPVVEVIDDTHQKFNGVVYRVVSSGHFKTASAIHRDVYAYYYGDIPDNNHHIHHQDFNKANNSVENLQLLTNSDHQILHATKKPYKVFCAFCGKEFFTDSKKIQKYCSQKCRDEHQKEKDTVTRICEFCGKEFTSVKKEKTRFCSSSCAMHDRYKDKEDKCNYYEIRQCEFCGKEFSVYKYDKTRHCSLSCAQKNRRKH